ncbi:hypothetical protein, partial [Klebsiella pneumoniae]|uniref:hypothetical protein n=1 Tax=Klebsiella pneumoniae TaxID=573 RepID=UPI00300ADC51
IKVFPNWNCLILFYIHKNLLYMGFPNINIGLMVVWFKKLYGVLNLVTSLVIKCVLPSFAAILYEHGYLTISF